MAPEETGITLGKKAVDQIGKTIREVSRRMMNEQPHRARWQYQGGTGGGNEIWFTINSVYCADAYDEKHLIVTATYYSRSCAGVPPGANADGTYNIYDVCGILDFYTDEWLASGGVVGRATYMYPLTGVCEPRWLVDTICGTPECA